jgi:MYXO-CTERM domain-containing protein
MRLSHLAAVGGIVSLCTATHAAVVASSVTASVNLASGSGSAYYSAGINKAGAPRDTGTLIGQFGTNAQIRGKWTAQMVGTAGSGAHGGNVYAIGVTIGSIIKVGPFAQSFTQPIVDVGNTIGGAAITSATVGFGAAGGGLRFDDFGGANQLYIDNSGTYGDASYSMRTDPNFSGGVTPNPSLQPTFASVASDGSVGFLAQFNVNSLWDTGVDVSQFFGGNLAAGQIRGFSNGFFVEVAAVPAPGAMALLGVAGLAGSRRRRA